MFLLFVDAILVNVELGPFENNCQGYDATATAGCFFRAKQRPEREGARWKITKNQPNKKSPNRINRFGLFCLALAGSIGGQVRNV
ncbi:hypothetical protein [Polaromonas sp.]|uniref:hypothetical protein n=1 Tax=Polaromonas sp. TaxID=1869339 RepID=UPI002488E1C0|nr:hypothetical protein [Polaromonas sp.]MDI1340455.1 hypothetical protein [Polaromonas sp.]